jgi:proline iminopeptidase
MAPPTRQRFVGTPHGRIYLELEGDPGAEPVVLVTGGPGASHDHHHPWFSALLPEHAVAYVDFTGCGRADPLADGRGYAVELFAADLESVREALGTEAMSLVGLSFGGFVATEYALEHPGRVRRLVLSNAQVTAADWQTTNIDGVNAELERLFPEEWRRLLELRADGVTSLEPRYQELLERVLPGMVWADQWQRPQLTPPPGDVPGFAPAVYAAVVGDDPEWEVTGTLAGYDRTAEFGALPPTLVVTGRHDRLTPPSVAYRIHERLDPARRELHVCERSAHRPWAEEPDEYFRVVKAFLAD